MRYEMFEGDFRIPDGYKQPTMAEGSRYRISDIYHLQIDPEIVAFVGIMPGWRVSNFVTFCSFSPCSLTVFHRVDNEKVEIDNNKTLELTNSTVFHRGRQ